MIESYGVISSSSYIERRTIEQNERFEVINNLHPLLEDLINRFGHNYLNDPDTLETNPVQIGTGWDIVLYRPEPDQNSEILTSGAPIIRPILISVYPSDDFDPLDRPPISAVSEDAQFALVIGNNGAIDRTSGEDLSVSELKSLLTDTKLVIGPRLEREVQATS